MGWLDSIYDALFGSNEPKFVKNPKNKKSYSDHSNGGKVVKVNFYTSEELFGINTRVSEKMTAFYLSKALSEAGYDHVVSYNFPVLNPPSETDKTKALRWFSQDSGVKGAKDSNMLLLNRGGGGLAYIGAKKGVVGVRHIDSEKSWNEFGIGKWYSNMSAMLHEVAHNLGYRHDHDHDEDGKQHLGMGWNEQGMWHRTPCNVDNGVRNFCGEWVEERQNNTTCCHMTYHHCAANLFKIR